MVELRTFVGVLLGNQINNSVVFLRCEMDFVHPQYDW